ncbi:MAG: hypothetical protein II725_07100 [Firmicutes bacterium]|nr:hypothetical protein [Bacillota bacterium]
MQPAYAIDNSHIDGVIQGGTVRTFFHNATQAHPASLSLDFNVLNDLSKSEFTAINPDFAIDTSTEPTHYNTRNCACYTRELPADAHTLIEGDCFSYKYPNAAVAEDGTTADILITFSNVNFYTPVRGSNDYRKYRTYDGWTSVAQGMIVRSGNHGNMHVGLKVDANIRIVDKSGNPIEGSFYFTINDIDVVRRGNSNYATLHSAYMYSDFDEQVLIQSGALSEAYITRAQDHKCVILDTDPSGPADANGLLFMPMITDDETYDSGFAVLADAGNGITVSVISGAGGWFSQSNGSRQYNKVDTILMTQPPMTFSLDISKTVGGNLGDKSKKWPFTLTLENEDGSPRTGVTPPPYITDWTETEPGVYTFALSHGENATLYALPDGIRYSISEGTAAGYEQKFTLTGGISGTGTETGVRSLTRNTKAAFTNTLEGGTPTGVMTGGSAGLLLLAAGLIGLLASAVLRIRRRRRA